MEAESHDEFEVEMMMHHRRVSLVSLMLGWLVIMMTNPVFGDEKTQDSDNADVTVSDKGKTIQLTASERKQILQDGIALLNSCKGRKKRKIMRSQIAEIRESSRVIQITFSEPRDFSPAAKPGLRADRFLIPLNGSLKSLIIVSNGATVYSPFNGYDMKLFTKLDSSLSGKSPSK